MAPNILATATLVNGLRTEFADTYTKIRNRQADGRLGMVMDLGIGATNREHDFAYFEAAPHMELWQRGSTIPQDAMGSVGFKGYVHEWARRVSWHKNDRKDDQTGSLVDAARGAGQSGGLLPERFFFDLLASTSLTLPGTLLAPDGAAFFATTAGGAARFGATNGNLLSGSGVATASAILTDYYRSIVQFMAFQDGKGQPLLAPELIQAGAVIIHSSADLEVFETAFLQKRQGIVAGTDAGTTPSNIVQDASRNVDLWASPRIATGDWYVFLKESPKKPTYLLTREPLHEDSSLEGNAGDHTRNTGEEYIQWEERSGAGIALPYGAIKINN